MPQCPNPNSIQPLHPKALEEIVVVAHPRVARLPLWGPSGLGGPQLSGTSTLSHNGQIQIPVTSCQEPGNSWYDTNLYPSVLCCSLMLLVIESAYIHVEIVLSYIFIIYVYIYIYTYLHIYINHTKHYDNSCFPLLPAHQSPTPPIHQLHLPSSASATAKTSEKYSARVSGGGLTRYRNSQKSQANPTTHRNL